MVEDELPNHRRVGVRTFEVDGVTGVTDDDDRSIGNLSVPFDRRGPVNLVLLTVYQ